MSVPRRASVLLEAIVALAIIGFVAASVGGMLGQAAFGSRASRIALQESQGATNLLEAVALWPEGDLTRRFGWRRQGAFQLEITLEAPSIFRATVWDSTGRSRILSTSIYRRASHVTP
jgi:hypothetical protein